MNDYSTMASKRIRCVYITFPLPPKAKEVHFKIMNDIHARKAFLKLRFNIDLKEFTFCNSGIETIEYLFFSCNTYNSFREDFYASFEL